MIQPPEFQASHVGKISLIWKAVEQCFIVRVLVSLISEISPFDSIGLQTPKSKICTLNGQRCTMENSKTYRNRYYKLIGARGHNLITHRKATQPQSTTYSEKLIRELDIFPLNVSQHYFFTSHYPTRE